MMFLRTTTLFALLLGAFPALAVKPFSANYQATMKGIQANAQLVLTAAGPDRWNYRLSVQNPLGNVTQTTVFEDRGGHWRPVSGSDSTLMLIKKSQTKATYDWGKGEARWSGDAKPGRTGPVKLQPGDMDALMLNLAIVRDVAAGKPLNYRMVDNGVARQQNYQHLEKEAHLGGKEMTGQGHRQRRTRSDRWGRGLPVRAPPSARRGKIPGRCCNRCADPALHTHPESPPRGFLSERVGRQSAWIRDPARGWPRCFRSTVKV